MHLCRRLPATEEVRRQRCCSNASLLLLLLQLTPSSIPHYCGWWTLVKGKMGDVTRRASTLPRRRRMSGTWTTISTLLRRKPFHMSEGRRSQVVLLDERRLDLIIQSRLYAGELLDIVASHFNLKEKDYFGIAFIDDSGQYSWLSLDKRVLEHEFSKKNNAQGTTLTLYFRIKYYVESITQLRDSATIEAFYLQTKSLIAKGELEIESEIVFQLAALVIQATYGDYTDESTFRSHLKRLPVLPTSTLKEFPSISSCEKLVLEHYKVLIGQTRGAAIVNYLSIVESLPTYGHHYYGIKDKAGNPCWLGLSYRGISQYDKNDRKTPRRVFFWKQLENLYFRDKKFTIEVHEARRVVHTLSSFNLYEDAIEEPVEEFDDLSNAICDPTTQVSVSRRALAPANVTVYVWYASSQNIAKCIWSMAISQHQFFLDRNQKKTQNHVARSLSQIASELCQSVQSLSSASSQSNISRSNSSASLPTIIIEGELSEESKAATLEMLTALQSRKDALQESLKKKTEELKALCLKEGELTGELPPETPFQPGEAQPQVRRRIGTSFTISDKVIYRAKSKEKETLNSLELDYEIQSKITSAALKLANDVGARKSVRKMRKLSYQQATNKLKDIEQRISTLKREKDHRKEPIVKSCAVSDNRLNFVGLPNSTSDNSISDHSTLNSSLSNVAVPSTSLPHLMEGTSSSAPPSPPKHRQRHQSLQHVAFINDDVYEDVGPPYNASTRRNSSSYSAASEYDAISCGSSSIASLGIPYRNRFETHLDIEGTNHYSVPNRRASQAFNEPDDLFLDDKSQDAGSQCYVDMTQSRRSANNSLSCSYDERLTFNKSDISLANKGLTEDCNYSKTYAENKELTNYRGSDFVFKPPFSKEIPPNDKFMHSHSVNSLHRTRSNSLHHKISEIHLSDPDLNIDSVDGIGSIRHGYSVPALKSTLRPLSSCIINSDYGSQSINQVADLVQASVLLQEGKRAASCNPEICSPKTKTKEWIETSLDSPIITRKRKPKISESSSHLQPTQWLENGLPNNVNESIHTYQTQVDLSESAFPVNDIQQQNPLNSSRALYAPDSRGNVAGNFTPLQVSPPRPHLNSNVSYYSDCNAYHHYENIAEVALNSPGYSKNQISYYENIPNEVDYNSNNSVKMPDIVENTIHSVREISIKDNFNEIHVACPAIAQPQEPSKHPKRSVEIDTHDYCNIPPDNDYEPIEFNLASCPQNFSQDRCDSTGASPQYAYHKTHSEPLVNNEDVINNEPVQWQHFPTVPLAAEKSSSPVSSNVNFSPSVEVNVVQFGHFQPYWEETKPYEISDFYKYSTKHRRQQKAVHPPADEEHSLSQFDDKNSHHYSTHSLEMNSESNHSSKGLLYMNSGKAPRQIITSSSVPIFDNQEHIEVATKYYKGDSPAVPIARRPDDSDRSLSLGEIDLSISLADTFHDEMITWYQSQESVKKATLV